MSEPQTIHFATFAGAELLDVAGPAAVFTAANQVAGACLYRVDVVALSAGPVSHDGGLALTARPLDALNPGREDTLLVVGGYENALRSALKNAELLRALRQAASNCGRIGSVCSGTFLLAAASVITNQRVATHWRGCAELAEYAKSNDVALGHFGQVLTPTQVTMAYAVNAGFEWGSDAAFDALDCNTLASGDADVINTTLQLILPCLDSVKVLTAITGERISLVPDAPAIGELDSSLDIALWNGLFVHKDTPADVREKIAAVAAKTVMSDRAQAIAKETGAQVYWSDAAASAETIAKDKATVAHIGGLLE